MTGLNPRSAVAKYLPDGRAAHYPSMEASAGALVCRNLTFPCWIDNTLVFRICQYHNFHKLAARLRGREVGPIGVERKVAVPETEGQRVGFRKSFASPGHYRYRELSESSAFDRPVSGPFFAEEQKPSTQPRKRLNSQITHKLTEIVSAPPQIPQVAGDPTIRYNRP
jgi:hypothetical protein